MRIQEIRTKTNAGDEKLIGYFAKESVLFFRNKRSNWSMLSGYKLYRFAKAIVKRYEHSSKHR